LHIPLSSPDINDEDRAAVLEVLSSPSLSLGPKLGAFEKATTQITGSRHAVATNSGTSALHLCVRAAGISDGDEVITTPFSFVASANCILFERGRPVFVDIDPVTYNIAPDAIEAAITPRTKAILPVHVFGRPFDVEAVLRIAKKHGLVVIEDACEAIGAEYRGRRVGSFGQTGVFAFYPNKQLTTGEGGVIVTDDDRVARQCYSWRNQGRGDSGGWLEHDEIGYNYRLSDINCALGISQMSRLDEIVTARERVAARYNATLSTIPEIVPPRLDQPDCRISWFVYVVRLADEFTRDHRDQLIAELRKRGIDCRNYFPPIHLQPLYQRMFGYRPGSFPVTERTSDRTLALPFFNRLSDEQIEFVCTELRDALQSLKVNASVSGWSSLQAV
jgi:perosamine synthetase